MNLRPYAVDLFKLNGLMCPSPQQRELLERLLEEDTAWFSALDRQFVRRATWPSATEALMALTQPTLKRTHHAIHRRIMERLCHHSGRILPNETLKHLDMEEIEQLDQMMAWLDAPSWINIEQFLTEGTDTHATRLDELNISWLDAEQCERMDDFFAELDWDELEEQMEDAAIWADDMPEWLAQGERYLVTLREAEACLHDVVQHASILVVFQE